MRAPQQKAAPMSWAVSPAAGRAGDALGNIHLIQSFVRLAAETGEMHRIIAQTLQAQFPVLNWWALLSVMTDPDWHDHHRHPAAGDRAQPQLSAANHGGDRILLDQQPVHQHRLGSLPAGPQS